VCVMCSLVLRDGDGVVRVIVVPSNLWRQMYSKCMGDKYSSMYGRHKYSICDSVMYLCLPKCTYSKP